jgi:hypothetical protein
MPFDLSLVGEAAGDAATDGGGDWLGGIGNLFGKAFDFLGENDWMGDAIVRLIAENPEMDYEQIIDLAITQSKLNAADVYTPQGTSKTTFDADGKPTVTQTYTPEIQALYEMLVGNAGAPSDTYHAPRNFDPMMGRYINDREQHMGLPQTEYEPWRSSGGGGVNFPQIVPNLPPGMMTTNNGTTPGDNVRADQGNGEMLRNDQMTAFMDYTIRNNSNWQSPDFKWEDAMNEYAGEIPVGTDPGMFEQFMVEHGDQVAGLAGGLSGVTGAGTIAKFIASKFQDNYWEDHQWANAIEETEFNADDIANRDAINNYLNGGAQQSPNYQPPSYLRGVNGSPWIRGSDGSVGYSRMPSSRFRNIGSVYDEPRPIKPK